MEEYTEGGKLMIQAEPPGLDKDVEISVVEGVLHPRAERREEKKEETRARYRSEFRYGAFRRAVALPAGASEQDIDASCANGILEVRVPLDGQQPPAKDSDQAGLTAHPGVTGQTLATVSRQLPGGPLYPG